MQRSALHCDVMYAALIGLVVRVWCAVGAGGDACACAVCADAQSGTSFRSRRMGLKPSRCKLHCMKSHVGGAQHAVDSRAKLRHCLTWKSCWPLDNRRPQLLSCDLFVLVLSLVGMFWRSHMCVCA